MKQRIRIAAEQSSKFVVQPKQHPSPPRASLAVIRRVKQATRRRRRNRAIITACIVHLIAGFFLIQSIKQSQPFDDTIVAILSIRPVRNAPSSSPSPVK